MPMRRLSLAVSPVLRFADWLFAAEASGADLFFALVSLWWLSLMVFRPAVFDLLPLVGLNWAPDGFWIGFVGAIILLHVAALWRPSAYRLRMGIAFASSWYWLTIAISLTRTGLSTGTGTYSLFGAAAAMLGVYLSGRGPHRA